ncbi:hypothetical protein F441_22592 [Phytophthora nicotianae CJ01A1]|uniref:Uncharacterized protein n=2 Tax=Phytophthora nicotianae TaxID=4792 RepID=W2HH59_PHYNI|nr:hypothetical protein L915_02500 [Phytophthora nicotianae]ETL30553.1 hypothetical protein L916_16498 [Phytophthora nicotianae]ETO99983.1 hypothetical protein F441_22592 [Phytophthora nicotianae CJ01A1]
MKRLSTCLGAYSGWGHGRRWSTAEDEALVRAYLHIS